MTLVTCAVIKGDLPIEIFWTLNGKSIETIDGINTIKTKQRVNQLSIDDVQAQHSGEYTCIARNKAGNTTFSAYLRVNGIFILCNIYFFQNLLLIFLLFQFLPKYPISTLVTKLLMLEI